LDHVARSDGELSGDDSDFVAPRQIDSVNGDVVVDAELGPKRGVARRKRRGFGFTPAEDPECPRYEMGSSAETEEVRKSSTV
jgi:hypothetical protein